MSFLIQKLLLKIRFPNKLPEFTFTFLHFTIKEKARRQNLNLAGSTDSLEVRFYVWRLNRNISLCLSTEENMLFQLDKIMQYKTAHILVLKHCI